MFLEIPMIYKMFQYFSMFGSSVYQNISRKRDAYISITICLSEPASKLSESGFGLFLGGGALERKEPLSPSPSSNP